MIPRDAVVIGHRPPLRPIEIGRPAWVEWPAYDERDEMWRLQRLAEGERIWKTVQEACA